MAFALISCWVFPEDFKRKVEPEEFSTGEKGFLMSINCSYYYQTKLLMTATSRWSHKYLQYTCNTTPSSYWYSTFRPHNSGAQSATLATGTLQRRLQGCNTRSSVAVWHFAIVPSWRLDSRVVADARERRLRSTASWTYVVTRTYSTFGDRAFVAAGPGLWNSLPPHLKETDLSYSRFR